MDVRSYAQVSTDGFCISIKPSIHVQHFTLNIKEALYMQLWVIANADSHFIYPNPAMYIGTDTPLFVIGKWIDTYLVVV